jgi:retron-type reverse transcriptase
LAGAVSRVVPYDTKNFREITMKTHFPLLAQIAAPKNLNEAWLKVHRKKSSGGLDRVSVKDFGQNLTDNLEQLNRELLLQQYIPEPLAAVEIPKKPGSREMRKLGLPSVRDKVVQEATRRIINPVLDAIFLDCSYGYRQGKGPQRAIGRVRHILDNIGCNWVVSADIDDLKNILNQTCFYLMNWVISPLTNTVLICFFKSSVTVTNRGR